MICGLLGEKLGHSYSPQIHSMLGGYEYRLFERESSELDAFFADTKWQGVNVTIPYKRSAMSYCDFISAYAYLYSYSILRCEVWCECSYCTYT